MNHSRKQRQKGGSSAWLRRPAGRSALLALALLAGMLAAVLSAAFFAPRAQADIDYNSIISDAEFSDTATMTQDQIQAFLAAHGSYLAGYTVPDDVLIGPDDNIDAKGWTAAQVIASAAGWYGINPEVILTTLQKEESLVTDPAPEQWRLDTAMGYGCPDSNSCNPQYQGFAKQVDVATWQFWFNMYWANQQDSRVAPYTTGNTVPIDSTSVYLSNGATASLYRYTPHLSGNLSFYNIYHIWFLALEAQSPAAGSTGVMPSSAVTARFSNPINAGTLSASSFRLVRHSDGTPVAATINYDGNSRTATLLPAADLDQYTAYDATVTAAIADTNGHYLPHDYHWSFTTGTTGPPRDYYFSWYDAKGMQDWVLMANPSTGSGNLAFALSIAGSRKDPGDAGPGPGIVPPGGALTPMFPGLMGGPVQVSSETGNPAIISQRSLMGDSFEEVPATEKSGLSDHIYWPWYDNLSPGMTNWVLIDNPSATDTVHVALNFTNQADQASVTAYSDIGPGQTWTPTFPGKMGGPVEVKASLAGSAWPSNPRPVIASQRVLSDYGRAFNEVPGTDAAKLAGDYIWTWYDNQTQGYYDWVLLANPGTTDITYQILLNGQPLDLGGGQTAGTVPAGGQVTPRFPGSIGGPLEVKASAPLIASQRIIAGPSFEEVPGYDAGALKSAYGWTWYDMKSAGAIDWVLVANPTPGPVYYEISFPGVNASMPGASGIVQPGGYAVPTFAGMMGGPVSVSAWVAKPDNTPDLTQPARVIASQRVLWNGYFNEVVGIPQGAG